MSGIERTLETIEDIRACVVRVVDFAKDEGPLWTKLFGLIPLFKEAHDLIKDASLSLPELQDLDAKEVGEVAEAAYVAMKEVIEHIAVG